MGDWRRVQILGLCDEKEVATLRLHLGADIMDKRWGCLHNGGICGLPNWAGTEINAVGNLGERGYDSMGVASAAMMIAAAVPSLDLMIHCGDDYEGDKCIATVRLSFGNANVGPPGIKKIPPLDEHQMNTNMLAQLTGRRAL